MPKLSNAPRLALAGALLMAGGLGLMDAGADGLPLACAAAAFALTLLARWPWWAPVLACTLVAAAMHPQGPAAGAGAGLAAAAVLHLITKLARAKQ